MKYFKRRGLPTTWFDPEKNWGEHGAKLISFPLLISNTIFGLHFASASQRNKLEDLRILAKQVARMRFFAAGISFVILFVFCRHLLWITLGENFEYSAFVPINVMFLQRYRLNLNHLTLPEIKDFNALGDRFCFREKAKRFS